MRLAPGRNQVSLTLAEGLRQTWSYIHKIWRLGSKWITVPFKNFSTDPLLQPGMPREVKEPTSRMFPRHQLLTSGIETLQVSKQTYLRTVVHRRKVSRDCFQAVLSFGGDTISRLRQVWGLNSTPPGRLVWDTSYQDPCEGREEQGVLRRRACVSTGPSAPLQVCINTRHLSTRLITKKTPSQASCLRLG